MMEELQSEIPAFQNHPTVIPPNLREPESSIEL